MTKEAQRYLKRYTWPGNVRQLQNIIRNIVVLNDEKSLGVSHLPPEVMASKATKSPTSQAPTGRLSVVQETISAPSAINDTATNTVTPPAQDARVSSNAELAAEPSSAQGTTIRPMWQIEREAIQQAIDYCDGNVLNAAVLLELSPSTVYRKKQAWEAEDSAS